MKRSLSAGGRSPPAEEPDLKVVIAKLSQQYAEIAKVVAQYMSQAGIDRTTRNANAVSFAEQIKRIVGGVETPPGKYPDCALIGRQLPNGAMNWFCSGVLVHPRVVLTAGHCHNPQVKNGIVALNAVDMDHLENAEIIGVQQATVNPQYPQIIGNDITALILRDRAAAAPVPIAKPEDIVRATQTTLVGFGNSDILSTQGFGKQREVIVDIMYIRRGPDDDLNKAEQTLGFESDREFVAGGGGHDSCNGDSGGPAYIDVDGVRKAVGLTSRATEGITNPCGEGGIYTRLDTQRPFISQVLKMGGIDDEL